MTNRSREILKLSSDEKLNYIKKLLRREDISEDALSSLKRAYPEILDSMLRTAIFHVYIEGVRACIDWLVDIEVFLQDSTYLIDDSKTSI